MPVVPSRVALPAVGVTPRMRAAARKSAARAVAVAVAVAVVRVLRVQLMSRSRSASNVPGGAQVGCDLVCPSKVGLGRECRSDPLLAYDGAVQA